MRRIGLLCLLLVLSGCGPLAIGGMNADQLREFAKIKDANLFCARGVYAGAIVTIMAVSTDKGVPAGITIKEDCSVVFDSHIPKP